MRKVKIITDSCSDLNRELREAYDIDYAKMNVVLDGEEKAASLDWEEFSPQDMYGMMREGKRVTSNMVPVPEFERIFEKYISEGCDIVYVGCSSALSGSVNTGILVAKSMEEKYPEAVICCVDALCSCTAEGILAIEASKLAKTGMGAREIAEELEKKKAYVNQIAVVGNLEYLKRVGRVTASSAFFGNLFGVKPILISDAEGKNVPVKKVKGRKASLSEIVNMLKEAVTDPENTEIFISHADCAEEAEEVKKEIVEKIAPKAVHFDYIGPIIGASVGPGTVMLSAWGKKVDYVG